MSEYKLLVIFMVVVGIIMAVALSPITALAAGPEPAPSPKNMVSPTASPVT